ncbi:MAG TPA: hypothetical protein VG890_01855 [Puia sp.]|nr:hypothetical protein [Puia sp.]
MLIWVYLRDFAVPDYRRNKHADNPNDPNAQELLGHMRRKLATRLDIDGVATKAIFQSLAENINPFNEKS